MVENKDITFVIQGPFIDRKDRLRLSTEDCINSIRKYFPQSKIIYSLSGSIKNNNIYKIVDRLILPEDTGSLVCGKLPNGDYKIENINRQINGVSKALKLVTTRYVVKFRSDFTVSSDKIKNILEKIEKSTAGRFEKRVCVASTYSMHTLFIPSKGFYKVPFHISDFLFIGLTNDVIKYWDGDLLKPDERIFDSFYSIPNVEQRLGYRFYNKYNLAPKVPDTCCCSKRYFNYSNKLVMEDFIFLSFNCLGVSVPLRFNYDRLIKHRLKGQFMETNYLDGKMTTSSELNKLDKAVIVVCETFLRSDLYKYMNVLVNCFRSKIVN